MTIRTGALFLGLTLAISVGCTKKDAARASSQGTISTNKLLMNTMATNEEKAENLARAAEQLLTVQGFAYASDVADQALVLDANNLRAQLIKTFLGPLMLNKGILARIAPLMARDPDLNKKYQDFMEMVRTKFPESTVKSFFMNGNPDIATEADAQNHGDLMSEAYRAIRLFAKNHKNDSITMMTSDTFFDSMVNRFKKACIVTEASEGEYIYDCPSYVNMFEVTLNQADFEGIQHIAAGLELVNSLLNSYELSGAIDVAIKHKGSHPAPQMVVDDLFKDSKFGTLRAGNGFVRIKEMGFDLVSGMRWVMDNQSTLCPKGFEHHRNRYGYLFDRGFCINANDENEVKNTLAAAEHVLNGGAVVMDLEDANGSKTPMTLKPAALMDQPIADLRVLMPLTFNSCNELVGVNDQSVGGLFPDADVNKVLQNSNKCTP